MRINSLRKNYFVNVYVLSCRFVSKLCLKLFCDWLKNFLKLMKIKLLPFTYQLQNKLIVLTKNEKYYTIEKPSKSSYQK